MRISNYQVFTETKHYHQENQNTKFLNNKEQSNLKNDKSKEIQAINISISSNNNKNELYESMTKLSIKKLNEFIRANRYELSKDAYTINSELEALSFETKANIQAENKNIKIDFQINLSRSFVQMHKIDKSSLYIQDPLVISLDGNMPTLSDKKIIFDIDSDGKENQISMLGKNSGFLALDLNENGKIDNGTELFGTKSGNGFFDLKKYDTDKNNWIDENDLIFKKLRIWIKNENEEKLISLGQVGIGAIFLGDTKTPFSIKNEQTNQLKGQLKNSSFVLFEDGSSSIISQIDLVKTPILKQLQEEKDIIKKNIGQNIYKSLSVEPVKTKKDKSLQEQLEELIQALEQKLQNAPKGEREQIQSRIIALRAQLLDLLSIGSSVKG